MESGVFADFAATGGFRPIAVSRIRANRTFGNIRSKTPHRDFRPKAPRGAANRARSILLSMSLWQSGTYNTTGPSVIREAHQYSIYLEYHSCSVSA